MKMTTVSVELPEWAASNVAALLQGLTAALGREPVTPPTCLSIAAIVLDAAGAHATLLVQGSSQTPGGAVTCAADLMFMLGGLTRLSRRAAEDIKRAAKERGADPTLMAALDEAFKLFNDDRGHTSVATLHGYSDKPGSIERAVDDFRKASGGGQ